MDAGATWWSQKGIPVRNLWFLLVHASGLAELLDPQLGTTEGDAELADLLGRLLAEAVQRRLRRGLGRGYVPVASPLTRVRGRIDWLATETGMQLLRGRVACRYDDFTFDRPRNRLARAALVATAARVGSRELSAQLRDLDRALAAWGVSSARPSSAALIGDMPGRTDVDERLMVEAARLALDLVLPAEADGANQLSRLGRDERLLRRIFESGVAGYLRHSVHGRDGWKVSPQHRLWWQRSGSTSGLPAILPNMSADIVLDRGDRRIVVDTKFTTLLAPRHRGGDALRSAHIYQVYAYVRSQEGRSAGADAAEGLLLYPAIGSEVEEATTIQGHRFRFATVDLAQAGGDLGASIRKVVCGT